MKKQNKFQLTLLNKFLKKIDLRAPLLRPFLLQFNLNPRHEISSGLGIQKVFRYWSIIVEIGKCIPIR